VAVGDRRVVDGRDRNRDCGCATALGVGHWRRARRPVVTGLVGEGVGRGLAAVVAVAEGAVVGAGVAFVGRVAAPGGREGVALGVGVVVVLAGRRALASSVFPYTTLFRSVAVGDRRVVDGRDRNRDCGCATALGVGHWRRARRPVVTGLVGEGVGRGLAAVVA